MVYRIGVFGDVHAGSPDAVSPLEYYIGDDDRTSARVSANKIQQYMFNQLEAAADNLGVFDLLLLMGDMCDGPDKKSQGKTVTCSNLDFQVDMCGELFSMFKPKKIISVSGSGYHNGYNLTTDKNVTDLLGAKLKVSTKHDSEQFVRAGERIIHARHFTTYIKKKDNRMNGLGNEIREFVNDGYYVYGENMPHIAVRAHTHYFEDVMTRGVHAFVNPCWKWRDEFICSRSVVTGDLGYMMFDVDGSYYEPYLNTFKLPARLDRSGNPTVL
jgi:hypothetical protein